MVFSIKDGRVSWCGNPNRTSLAGLAIYTLKGRFRCGDNTKTFLWLCLLFSVCPDFDFLPGIVQGKPVLYHQGISHSLGFALGVICLVALVYTRKQGSFFPIWSLLSLSYISHLVIDLFGADSRPPYGLPLFWPLTNKYFLAPIQIFWGVHHDGSPSADLAIWVTSVASGYNLVAIGIEILVLLPLVFVGRFFYIRRFQA